MYQNKILKKWGLGQTAVFYLLENIEKSKTTRNKTLMPIGFNFFHNKSIVNNIQNSKECEQYIERL